MEKRRVVKPHDLPHPLDWFCARLRAARIRFRASVTDEGTSVEILDLRMMDRALDIWLATRREETYPCRA
jgi:hypothetical protein